MTNSEIAKELTLVLAYLTSWNEFGKDGPKCLRTWTGYDFDILKALSEEELIYGNKPGNKSFYFTEEGEKKAQELLGKLSKCFESDDK